MATEKEFAAISARYEKATRELARVCKVRIRVRKTNNYHSGIRIAMYYPGSAAPYPLGTTNWLEAFQMVERVAKREGIPLPPSAEALLKEESKV